VKSWRTFRAQRTRARLIAAASLAFAERGWDGVNLRDLARSQGLSTGAVYQHFASKAALWRAATDTDPPDVLAFLGRVQVRASLSSPDLAAEAEALRRALFGARGPQPLPEAA